MWRKAISISKQWIKDSKRERILERIKSSEIMKIMFSTGYYHLATCVLSSIVSWDCIHELQHHAQHYAVLLMSRDVEIQHKIKKLHI